MEYQEFLYAVKEELDKTLEEGIKASVYTAVKNNGREKKGIMIEAEGCNASPAIYLEGFYVRFKRGEPLERLIREITAFYESVKQEEIRNLDAFTDYRKIRTRIAFKLVHRNHNRRLLMRVPYVEVMDLAIVFYVLMDMKERGTATIQICNEHLEKWGITREELFQAASGNIKRLLPAEFFTMQYAIEEMMKAAPDEETENLFKEVSRDKRDVMYVLTNAIRNYGAACMIYPHVLEMIGDMIREDFYILPSSVHEVIIVPLSKAMEPHKMDEMVVEINEAHVPPEEILSDHAYFYRQKDKRLMLRKQEYDS